DHGGLFEAEIIRQAIENALRHGDVFRESAVTAIFAARDSEHPAVFAQINFTATAMPTFTARNGGIEGDAVAFFPAGHGRADFGDGPGGFVAHDDRGNAPARAAVHAVD